MGTTPWRSSQELAEHLSGLRDPILLHIAGHFVGQHRPADLDPLVSGNIGYPVAVFDAAVRAGITRLVNVGTAWEVTDTGAPVPQNLYAALKAANAGLLNWFAQAHGLRAMQVKLLDTFGGDDTRAKLMPMLKARWQDGATAGLRYAEQTINLAHITDVVEGLLHACLASADVPEGTPHSAFLTGAETLSLEALVYRIGAVTGRPLVATFDAARPASGALRGVWDDAPSLSGWRPRVGLDDGLHDYFKGEA